MTWWKIIIRFHKWMYPKAREGSAGYRIARGAWEWFMVAMVILVSSCFNFIDIIRGRPISRPLKRYDHPRESEEFEIPELEPGKQHYI